MCDPLAEPSAAGGAHPEVAPASVRASQATLSPEESVKASESTEVEMAPVTVYGADWCVHSLQTREELDSLGVNYDYIDVDKDKEAEEKVIRWNGGEKRKIPVVLIQQDDAESMVIAPTRKVLEFELTRLGLMNAA
jgi:mycoredoxin